MRGTLKCVTLDNETDLSVSKMTKFIERDGVVPLSIYDLDTLTITKTMDSIEVFKKKFADMGMFDYILTTPVRVGTALDLNIIIGYDCLLLNGKPTLWDMDFDKIYHQYGVYFLRDDYKVGGVRWVKFINGVVIVRFEVIHRYKPLSMQGVYLVDMYYCYEDALLEKVFVNNTQIFDQSTDIKKSFARYKLSGGVIDIESITEVYKSAKGS